MRFRAGEAALVNALSPGDKVLMVETGHFASLWRKMAGKFGLQVELIATDWRRGADPAAVEFLGGGDGRPALNSEDGT